MTAFAMVVPFRRTSPIYLPRRDLFIPASDSLSLSVTVVESDDPSALALQLQGGTGFPQLRMTVWREPHHNRWSWDYGACWDRYSEGRTLWSGVAQVGAEAGEFILFVPAETFALFPPRCMWGVQLGWDEISSDILAIGSLHVFHGGSFTVPIPPVGVSLTDADLNPLVDADGNLIIDGGGPVVIEPPPPPPPPPPPIFIPSLNFSDARNGMLSMLGWG